MARLKRSTERSISETSLRKALMRLKPPTDTMLFDGNMLKFSRKLDAVLDRGGKNSRQVQRMLDEFTARSTPAMHTRGGTAVSPIFKDHKSIFSIFNGLYLPVDEPAFYVPANRRYFADLIQPGAMGSASAYKSNGKLTAIQHVNLDAHQESTIASVYIVFKTDLARYGQVSRITLEPNIDWDFRDWMSSNRVWTDDVAHLDGRVYFTVRLWLTGYEFNFATNKFEPILPPSAVKFQVWQSSHYVTDQSEGGISGSLRNGAARFNFIASPARTYALGVSIELIASHDLRNARGGAIPKPTSNDFNQYALLHAHVPEMWLSHEVLAK